MMNTRIARTTIRIQPSLKKAAEARAVELNVSLQSVINSALELYLEKSSQQKARKLVFKSRALGLPLDNLSREDIYAD